MEMVGRRKLNGHLFDYAPLSRVLELEGLRRSWRACASSTPVLPAKPS